MKVITNIEGSTGYHSVKAIALDIEVESADANAGSSAFSNQMQ